MQQGTLAWWLAAISTIAALVLGWMWFEGRGNLERLEVRNNNVLQDRARLNSDLTSLRSNLSNLEFELSQARNQGQNADSLASELAQLNQSQQQLRQALSQAEQLAETRQQSLQALEQRLADSERERERLEALAQAPAASSTDPELAELNEQLQALNQERDQLAEQLNSALTALERTEAQQAQLMAQLAQLDGATEGDEASDSSEALANLEAQLAAAQLENSELKQRLESYQGEVTDLQQVARELRDARTAAEQAQNLLAEQENQLAQLNRQLDSRNQEVDQLNQSLEAATDEGAGIRSRLAELDQELSLLDAERLELESTRDNTRQALQAAEERARQLLDENQAFRERIEQLQTELAQQSQASLQLADELQDLNQERDSLVSALEDGRTVIRLQGQLLFPSGTAEISEQGLKALAAVARSLSAFPNHRISIEGHTDDRPIGSTLRLYYPSNWELATARASAAVRELSRLGIAAERMQAVGHASNQPVDDRDTAAARQQNRRIDILLFPPVELIFKEPTNP